MSGAQKTPHTEIPSAEQSADRWEAPPQVLTHDGPPERLAVDHEKGAIEYGDDLFLAPPGPVAQSFLYAPERISCLMGPLGSGKTTELFVKALFCAMMVPPSPLDGIRYAKWVFVRDNYRELDKTTIATYLTHFPATLGTFKGGGGAPAEAVIDWTLDDGTTLHMENLFIAIADQNVKTFCDGFEVTGAAVNAMDSLPSDLLGFLWPRTGRWPPPKHRPANWRDAVKYHRKLFGDMNAPDLDNWTYGDEQKQRAGFKEHTPKGWKLFTQPGGMDASAENKGNLPPNYYEELIADHAGEDWWINRFVHNKFGYSRSGKPVFENWNEDRHMAKEPLPLNRWRKLLLGIDQGRKFALIAAQRSPNGAARVLNELVPDVRMGPRQAGKLASQWLADNFADAFAPQGAGYRAWGDPAGFNPDQTSEEEAWMEIFAEHAGIKIEPAPDFRFAPRFEAVDSLLRESQGGEEMFQLSPACRMLRRGFNSGYRYGNTKTHGDEITTPDPVKNDYADPHDALQYVLLGSSDWQALKFRDGRKPKTIMEVGWHPHNF